MIPLAFADFNGKLKLHFKENVKNRIGFSVINSVEVAVILGMIEHFQYSNTRNFRNLFNNKEKIAMEVT